MAKQEEIDQLQNIKRRLEHEVEELKTELETKIQQHEKSIKLQRNVTATVKKNLEDKYEKMDLKLKFQI